MPLTLIVPLLLCFLPNLAWAEALPFTGLLPAEAKTTLIIRQADLSPPFTQSAIRIRIGPRGRPYLLAGNLLLGIAADNNQTPYILRVPGKHPPSDAAWMADDTLVLIRGKNLGLPSIKGFHVLMALPEKNMRLHKAARHAFYVYGGTSNAQKRSLFLYEKGGRLLHLLRMPEPITAITGTGLLTFFSVGNVIFRLLPGKKVGHVYRADAPITALTLADTGGLFFTTTSSAGYVVKENTGFTFLKSKAPKLVSWGQNLFLYLPEYGVIKISPISSFDALAKKLKKKKSK